MNTVRVRGYGLELRTRIVALVEDVASPEEAARHFSVHVTTVQRYLARHRSHTLHIVPKPTGRYRVMTPAHEQQLLAHVERHGDATLQEHAARLEAATGLKVSFKTVDRVIRRHHITQNKILVARERHKERRTAFLNDLQPDLAHPERLIFVDESGFNTSMTRDYARAKSSKGSRCCASQLRQKLHPDLRFSAFVAIIGG